MTRRYGPAGVAGTIAKPRDGLPGNLGEVGEPGGAKGSEEALDFSLSGGLVGSGVDTAASIDWQRGSLLRMPRTSFA